MPKKRGYTILGILILTIGSFIISLLLWQMYTPRAESFGNFPSCNPADHGDCPYLNKKKP